MRLLRVLVADRDSSFAGALTTRIGTEPDIVVIATAASAADAERLASVEHAQVAVVGETAPAGSNGGLIRRLAAADVSAVLLSFEEDPAGVTGALLAGVRGFLPKDAPTEDVVRAVRAAARGDVWVEPRVLGGVLRRLGGAACHVPSDARLERLTEREREVLDCLVKGLDYTATARTLFLSASTVRGHVRTLRAKLGGTSTVEAVALAAGEELGRRVDRAASPELTGPAPERSHF